jgi:hypothetical protein
MKTVTKITFVLALLVSTTGQAASINERQQNQQQRVEAGIKSGELTKHESSKLGKQQLRITKKEQAFRSDGDFTKIERAKIQNDLTKSSARIYQQKHDQQER